MTVVYPDRSTQWFCAVFDGVRTLSPERGMRGDPISMCEPHDYFPLFGCVRCGKLRARNKAVRSHLMTMATAITTATLTGVDEKIRRATFQANQLDREIARFTDRQPFAVRVDKEPSKDGHIGRLVALKNSDVGEPDVSIVLHAGEILYQLRSSLDHLLHQTFVILANSDGLSRWRRLGDNADVSVSPAATLFLNWYASRQPY